MHEAARTGFARGAGDYARGRPEYPEDAVRALLEACGVLEGGTIVELGAGTGKLTCALAADARRRVIAVEPIAEMRARIDPAPNLLVLEGTAEAIPCGAAEADAVIAAQAFHWFDGPRALAEIARVLRPGGVLGLAWNVRDDALPWVKALERTFAPYEAGVPRWKSGEWRRAFEATALFGALSERSFSHVHHLSAADLVARVVSISFVAALDDARREAVAREVRAIAPGPEVDLPYLTHVYWCVRA